MGKIYGYARISTKKQSLDRQMRNILLVAPDAHIIRETYTGTTSDRCEWNKLKKILEPGDKVIFDSVSRMSRNAADGFAEYKHFFDLGITLEFIKEPHINSETYNKALQSNVLLTGTKVDLILSGVNEYLMALAEEQIKIAFWQAEKEVEDLRTRTAEGIMTAKLNGKRIGIEKGRKLTTQKSHKAKKEIQKYSKYFQGTLSDVEVMKLIGISKNTYYKYKMELKYPIE
ncbi:DNA invertase Pin-like site-specific DNA recombinase [Clostridiales Family XIII bacterium PM5-7]